jgi:uncharacterized circularly permuted ATP-grasp superfamily protein
VLDAYSALLDQLGKRELEGLREAVQLRVDAIGADFGTAAGRRAFPVDPIPRIIGRAEWESLAAGAAQRVRALNAFIADAYGRREIVAAGILPERALTGGEHFESGMEGLPPAPTVAAPVAGLDVVRDGDGNLLVLEDNLRTPSGLAYLEAARSAADAELPGSPDAVREPIEPAFAALRKALDDARGEIPGEVVMLSDGPANSAWFEHRVLADRMALPLVTFDDLYTDSGRLHARVDGASIQVAALYRRTDVDRLTDAAGNPTDLAALLHGARAEGNLAIIDDFGTGIGDDKLIHAYVEDMVRFYLGEEPVIRSVRTFDLARPEALEEVADRIDEMVIKPRTGHGGDGIVVCAHASAGDRARALAEIRARPEEYVAQPMVSISRHPTVIDGKLEPRHVDLRVFVITSADGEYVVPGGLTRVALGAGALVVNSSQAGGGKDTWVLK